MPSPLGYTSQFRKLPQRTQNQFLEVNNLRYIAGSALTSFVFVCSTASGQGIIVTVAGSPVIFPNNVTVAVNAPLGLPTGVAVDSQGNVYVADSFNNRVFEVSPNGGIQTVAGNGLYGFSGDGGPAAGASLAEPSRVALDTSGNLFITDYNNYRIRKVSTNGIITTVAGNGTQGYSGDGGPATAAELDDPAGLAVDASGNVFIADQYRIRKVSANGIITTVAGNGKEGYSGDGGPATLAELSAGGLALDASGGIFFTDTARVREVSASGIVTTIAGNGSPGFSGDGGPATAAQLSQPEGVAVTGSGILFIRGCRQQ
jgi:sugar lactone lactonase YvrE